MTNRQIVKIILEKEKISEEDSAELKHYIKKHLATIKDIAKKFTAEFSEAIEEGEFSDIIK